MDWKRETVEQLRQHSRRQQAVQSLQERIDILATQYGTLKSAASDREPVQGGGSRMEDSWINNIVERDRLEENLQLTTRKVAWLEQGFRGLSKEERTILYYFYVNRPDNYREYLCDTIGVEQTRMYQMKDQALEKLTLLLYGS